MLNKRLKISFVLIGVLFLQVAVIKAIVGDDIYNKHYYCTPSDAKHYHLLKNLIGSIHHADFENLGEIAVFNLGLIQQQIDDLKRMERVKVYDVEMTNPHLLTYFVTHPNGRAVRGYFAWKPVIIKQALERYPYVLYMDAGTTVLKPLDDLFSYIQEHGYFLLSNYQSPICNIANRITKKVLEHLVYTQDEAMQKLLLDENTIEIDAGLQGVSRACMDTYVQPLYAHSKDLTLFEDDGSAIYGYGEGRHDQILFSIYAYCQKMEVHSEGWVDLPLISGTKHTHIHWHPEHVIESTSIYRSRHDIQFNGGKTHYIRYKKVQVHEIFDEAVREKLHQIGSVAYSTRETLYASYNIARECITQNIPGDFVECGVAGGAQVAVMAYACQTLNEIHRRIHLFDSFEGIPLAGPNDDQQPGLSGDIKHSVHVQDLNELLVSSNSVYPQLGQGSVCSMETVKQHINMWALQNFRFVFHKGWFQHVLPKVSETLGAISLLRLDGDLYESTKVCLEYLYPKVSKGGYVIIDDYALTGCRKAVHEYLDKYSLKPTIIPIEGGIGPVYWRVE